MRVSSNVVIGILQTAPLGRDVRSGAKIYATAPKGRESRVSEATPPFCGDTWTYYSRNHATADVNGTHGFTDNTYATGKCSTWLWTDYLFEPGLYH